MKFHHINESEEEDPFADPNPTDLTVYLAKLKAQRSRAAEYRHLQSWKIHELVVVLHDATGEKDSLYYCPTTTSLHAGWTKVGLWQLSPRVMAEPSIHWVIQALTKMESENKSWDDLNKRIKLIKNQIQLAHK